MRKWKEAHEAFGRAYWSDLQARLNSNVSAMARASGLRRGDVYKRLKRFKVVLPPSKYANGWNRKRVVNADTESAQRL